MLIMGMQDGIRKGEFDTDEPELVATDQLPAETLVPLPMEVLEETGVLDCGSGTRSHM